MCALMGAVNADTMIRDGSSLSTSSSPFVIQADFIFSKLLAIYHPCGVLQHFTMRFRHSDVASDAGSIALNLSY
jgi:hypothetical protein